MAYAKKYEEKSKTKYINTTTTTIKTYTYMHIFEWFKQVFVNILHGMFGMLYKYIKLVFNILSSECVNTLQSSVCTVYSRVNFKNTLRSIFQVYK